MVKMDNMADPASVGSEGRLTNATTLVDPIVNIKVKLAIMWTVLMFFYLYNDVFTLFRQDTLEGLLAGNLEGFAFTQEVLVGAALLMSFPIFMILLSVVLPARTNRRVNMVAGMFHLVLLFATGTVGDGPWAYFALYMVFEGIVIAMITWYAWKWPIEDGTGREVPRIDGAELGI